MHGWDREKKTERKIERKENRDRIPNRGLKSSHVLVAWIEPVIVWAPLGSKVIRASDRADKKESRKAAYSLVSGALAVGDRNQTFLQLTTYHLQE